MMPAPEHDLPAMLKEAVALHQSGNLDGAEKIYADILRRDDRQAGALTLLGTLLLQKGRTSDGITRLEQSLEIDPRQPMALYNRGTALIELRRYADALDSCERALALRPDYAEAHCKRGIALAALGRHSEALVAFDKALALRPGYADAHHYRGNALKDLGRPEEALASYGRALAVDPRHLDAQNNRASTLMELKRYEDAVAGYDRALAIAPDYAPTLYNRGNALRALFQPEQALASYDAALALQPDYPEARNNRALALEDMRKFEEALADYDRALALKADYAEALHNRGNVLRQLERLAEALGDFDRALAIKPDDVATLNDRCLALRELDRNEEALAGYARILTLKPDYAEALNNRGVMLAGMKRYDQAFADYDAAISAKPEYAEAHFNKALLKLQLGQHEEGWRLYEWRWKISDRIRFAKTFDRPLWLGEESIAGKTLLLHAEQAFGDTLQFVRYAALAEQAGAHIVLEVQAPLARLMASSYPNAMVIAAGSERPPFDCHCPLASLPLAFRTTADTIPATVPYLSCDKARLDQWQNKLGAGTRPRIGIAWSGSGAYHHDVRSMPAAALAPLWDLGLEFHSLQKEVVPEDEEILRRLPQVHRHENELNDFADTAALIEGLDLVLSVDTSVAHLAGALGRPTWVLLAHSTDWRWTTGEEDSRWYPTACLFRQTRRGDWSSVIARVAAEITR